MFYEMRVYTPHDGKAAALRERFLTRTMPIFERLGIEVVNVFAPAERPDELWYISKFADEATRNRCWDDFKNDAEWQQVKSASETDGPLLKAQTITVLTSLS